MYDGAEPPNGALPRKDIEFDPVLNGEPLECNSYMLKYEFDKLATRRAAQFSLAWS